MYTNSTDTRAKTFVVFLSSLAALAVFVLATRWAVFFSAQWYGLIVGVLLMVVAIPLHMRGKRRQSFYVYSFLANLVGCGFSASAFYLTEGFDTLGMGPLLLGTVPALILLTLLYLVLHVAPQTKCLTLSFAIILVLALCIGLLSQLPYAETLSYYISFSFGAFSLLIALFSISVFAITVNRKKAPVLKQISLCSFGAFAALSFLILIILSEGEILSGLDFGGSGNKRPKKKNKL